MTIERLGGASAAEIQRVGGKAAGLARLMAAGFDVPETWVIPADVSRDASRRQQCLGAGLATWWTEVAAAFPGSRWAVRSSAVAEDLEGASFAGVYETVLDVDSKDALVDAVEQCWASIAQDRAARYLDTQQMDADAGIAVVLQRMIEADIAGVMLTENPLRPFDAEVVADAAWGLGEAVVSGRTEPDHVALDRATGKVLRTRIGAKQVETVWVDGLVERAVPAERRAVCCLSAEHLGSLHDLAARVETEIGPRRDLEWALANDRLFVLQDRPITGLAPREPREVYSRRFGDEYVAEYTTPLGWDLMGAWMVGPNIDEVAVFAGRPEITALQKFRRHDGYIYLNGDYALEMARSLPVASREQSPLASWFDTIFGARVMAVPFERRLLVRTLTAPRRDRPRGGLRGNLTALQRHCRELDERLVPKLRQDYGALTDPQWRTQFAEADRFGADHFRVIRWGMGLHGPVLQVLLEKLLTSWTDTDTAQTLQTLISGLPGTHTAAINRDIWDLGRLVREEPDLLVALRSDRCHSDIRSATATAPFWGRFDAFLAEHGHRSATREISAQRWHEQPDVVLALVRAQVRPEQPSPSPAESEAAAQRRRIDAEQRVRAGLGAGPVAALRRAVLGAVLRRLQEYTVYRENQRYHLDYILDHLRLLLLEQGRRLTERGILADPAEVFLLSGETFWRVVDGTDAVDGESVAAEVAAARSHRERNEARLPAAYLFDGVPTEGKTEAPAVSADGALAGYAASAGRAEGVVKSVATLADLASVQQGDILLASNIDPGWTSVFPLIVGLVTETGGILSHGAILAREYGIPTVTSVDGARGLLPTGTRVRVDGSAGTVTILDPGTN